MPSETGPHPLSRRPSWTRRICSCFSAPSRNEEMIADQGEARHRQQANLEHQQQSELLHQYSEWCLKQQHAEAVQILPKPEANSPISQIQAAPGHEYANLSVRRDAPAAWQLGSCSNYMDLDYSTGVGKPAATAWEKELWQSNASNSCSATSTQRLDYAQLDTTQAPPAGRAQPLSSRLLAVSYCELDLRATEALADTLREEQQQQMKHYQHQHQQQDSEQLSDYREIPLRASSFSRIRSAVSRSLSRLSGRRQLNSLSQGSEAEH